MSLTPEERQEIINAACEKALLMLPEVVGTLMTNHAALVALNTQFYKDHPEFAAHKAVVQSVIEEVEGRQPTRAYKDLLTEAVPIIAERIRIQGGLDMTTVKRPDRHLPNLAVEIDRDHPHGAL